MTCEEITYHPKYLEFEISVDEIDEYGQKFKVKNWNNLGKVESMILYRAPDGADYDELKKQLQLMKAGIHYRFRGKRTRREIVLKYKYWELP